MQRICYFLIVKCAFIKGKTMIKYESSKQLKFENFIHPFGNNLSPNNRWVKMAELIPWDDLATVYYEGMSKGMGAPATSGRIVIGSLIIKHKLNLSDEETAEQIRENPYLQYFLGLEEYEYKYVFVPSLFVEIRKRLGGSSFTKLNNLVIEEALKKKRRRQNNSNKDDSDDEDKPGDSGNKSEESVRNGKLIMDATVAEQAIKYPNDLDLLNESREISESIIDYLYKFHHLPVKPRTYRKVARKEYLSVSKLRKKSRKKLRSAVRKQLNYLKRNFRSIESMANEIGGNIDSLLTEKLLEKYRIIQAVYTQQKEMFENKKHRCENRIVSIHQPHIRPIVRGKTGKSVEFGSKLGVSLIDGFARIDHLSWDAYNEGSDLKIHLENYEKNYGCLPESVVADNIYGTRENRKLLKELGIKFSGKPLGRPKKETEENREKLRAEKERRRREYRDRIPIEGKFGQGKNGYRLNYIKAKTKATSESWIHCIFFVMNIVKLVKMETDFILSCFQKAIFRLFSRFWSDKMILEGSNNVYRKTS